MQTRSTNYTNMLSMAPTMKYQYGLRQLDQFLNPVADISDRLNDGSSISSDITASYHRTCSLILDTETQDPVTGAITASDINTQDFFYQPYVIVTDPDGIYAEETFNLGVYVLTSPTRNVAPRPAQATYTGYDLLYILDQPITSEITVTFATDPVATTLFILGGSTVIQLIQEAWGQVSAQLNPFQLSLTQNFAFVADASQSFTYAPAGYNITSSSGSDGATTYLGIINDVLSASGYQPIWCDWDGTYILQPTKQFINGMQLEATYNQAGGRIAEGVTQNQDLFDVPNRWVFVMDNLTAAPVEGTTQYTVNNTAANDPSSQANRSYIRTATYTVGATSYQQLVQAGNIQVLIDQNATESWVFSVMPDPTFWHYDYVKLEVDGMADIDPNDDPGRDVLVTQWTLPLDMSGDMQINASTLFYTAT